MTIPTSLQAVAELSSPRSDARVTFPDGRVYSAPVNTPLTAYTNVAFPPADTPIGDRPLGAIIDNRLCELTYIVTRDVPAIPITLRQSDGNRMYRRSLVFLLTIAANEVFPGVKIAVEHSVSSGGFYCEPENRANFTRAELQQIKRKMKALIAEDIPIERTTIPLTKAIERFKRTGDDDMVRLLEFRTKSYLTVYTLRDSLDYFFGYMLPSTGYMTLFELQLTATGFILGFPRADTPDRVLPYKESYKLESVFRQTDQWLGVMGLEDVGRLNQSIEAGRIREEVLVAEALHQRHLAETARLIAQQHEKGARLVLLAGPSSAGKTTTSKRLAVQLMAYGIQPYALGMDDYFVDRELTPRDDMGEFDFESLYALNLARFNKDLLALMQGAEVQLPRYDFKLGKSQDSHAIKLTPDHILIVEGIHGLNPELVSDSAGAPIPHLRFSADRPQPESPQSHPDDGCALAAPFGARRGTSRLQCARHAESVGERPTREEKNIFPYQENADVMFNSSLAYELAVLRPFAEPLLRQVEIDSPRYIEARRLLAFLSWVRSASADYVPDDSLLREFIGGSIFETYVAGSRFL